MRLGIKLESVGSYCIPEVYAALLLVETIEEEEVVEGKFFSIGSPGVHKY